MDRTITPRALADLTTARKQQAEARYADMRRADAAQHGYHGPLTRAEASAQALAALASR